MAEKIVFLVYRIVVSSLAKWRIFAQKFNKKKLVLRNLYLRGLSANENFADLISLINLKILFDLMSNFQIFILEAFYKRIIIFSLIRRLLKILIFHGIMVVSQFRAHKKLQGSNFKSSRSTFF